MEKKQAYDYDTGDVVHEMTLADKLAAALHELWRDWVADLLRQGVIMAHGSIAVSPEAAGTLTSHLNRHYRQLPEARQAELREAAAELMELMEAMK